jgi:DNA-directed RNA polymerase specialized sigma24 family protein
LSRLPEAGDAPGASFLAYLHQALRNQLTDEWRRTRSRPAHVEIDEHQADPGPSPLQESADRDRLASYQEALARLSPADQEILVARLEFEMAYADICRHTGHPTPDAARMAYVRAVQRLAAEMKAES